MSFDESKNRENVVKILNLTIQKIELIFVNDVENIALLLNLIHDLRRKIQQGFLEEKTVRNQLLEESFLNFDQKCAQVKRVEDTLKQQRDVFRSRFHAILNEIDNFNQQLISDETEFKTSSMQIYNEVNRKVLLDTKQVKTRNQNVENETDKLACKLETILESHQVSEKVLRAKKSKKDDQLSSVIENYHNVIGDKDFEIVTCHNVCKDLSSKIIEYGDLIRGQESYYVEVMKQKQLDELDKFERRVREFRYRRACRIIGDWWHHAIRSKKKKVKKSKKSTKKIRRVNK